jgi:pteridine reductase
VIPKTVLITGAARRIGAAIAHRLHAAGMNLAIHYRGSKAEADELCASLNRQRAGSAVTLQADLLHTSNIRELIHNASEIWGGLDVLVNNASTFYATPVEDVAEEQWDELIGSNLKAPFFLSQAAAPLLKKRSGCIVNIIDIHAKRPLKGYPVYSITKTGLAAMTRALAKELGPEIRVNGVAPGAILWPEANLADAEKKAIVARTVLKRTGCPNDVARTVLFLIRDADYITGQLLAVDGGRSLFS